MSVASNRLELSLKDSPFDPDHPSPVVLVRKTSPDRPLYRVFLYLEGPDLPFVKSVTYHLHETFAASIRRVDRSPSNPHCKLEIWTWGLFLLRATVHDKSGNRLNIEKQLDYDRTFQRTDIEFRDA